MAKYAVLLDVYCVIEADSEADAERLFWEADPLAHYVDGYDVVHNVDVHGIDLLEED